MTSDRAIRVERVTDLTDPHALRRRIFIDEQGVSEAEEMDELDGEAIHLVAYVDDLPMGTARLLRRGDLGKIGRVCVLKEARGTGLGAVLMQAALDIFAEDPALNRAYLSAQTHALGFYARLGFVAEGPEYPDAGIPHRDMYRPLR